MTVRPKPLRSRAIDKLFTRLKATGVYATLDALYLFASHHEQAARLNLISADFTARLVRQGGQDVGPEFVADRYYGTRRETVNGQDQSCFLNTDITTSAASKKLTQTNAHLAVIAANIGRGSETWGGEVAASAPAGGIFMISGSRIICRLFSNGGGDANTAVPKTGFFAVNRLANRHTGYVDGNMRMNDPNNNTTSSEGFVFGGSVARGASVNLLAGAIGSSLTPAQTEDLRLALNEYLVGIGALAG